MKIKVSEATPLQLDWLVAKAAQMPVVVMCNPTWAVPVYVATNETGLYTFAPATNWEQGGPIIEREGIELHGSILDAGNCWAQFYRPHTTFDGGARHYHRQEGSTPLIAAMRCFICSRFGEIVEVPDELLESF